MAKLKKNSVIVILCVVLALSTIFLFVQNGRLRGEKESLLATQAELKQQIASINTRLADATKRADSLQKQLEEAKTTITALTNDREALLEKIENLKREMGASSGEKTP